MNYKYNIEFPNNVVKLGKNACYLRECFPEADFPLLMENFYMTKIEMTLHKGTIQITRIPDSDNPYLPD